MSGNEKKLVGWREWVALPELGIARIKAKIDTGARTSALHAYMVEPIEENGRVRLKVGIHPRQRKTKPEVICIVDPLEQRDVTDSGGHTEQRWVIETRVRLGDDIWPIELTLTARDDMRFRMLLGRTAIRDRYTVDSSRSYVIGKRRTYETKT